MSRKTVRPDDFEEIWANFSMTTAEIATHYGVSLWTINTWKHELHLPRRPTLSHREHSANWKGGIHSNDQGYIFELCPHHPHADSRGYVRQHRLVMEAHLGRYLLPTESVHHKNEVRSDNRLSNLQLFASHAEHLSEAHSFPFPEGTDLRRLYVDEKMSTHDIAKMYGCTHNCISKALRKLGVHRRTIAEARKNRVLPSDEILAELWKTKTAAEIAAIYDVSSGLVKQHFRRRKMVAPRRPGQRVGTGAKYPDDETLLSLMKTMTQRQLADFLGVPYYGLTSYMSHRGLRKYPKQPAESAHSTPAESKPKSHHERQPDVPACSE